MSDVEAIVGDVGSAWTRIGMAGESSPKAWFPSVLGKVGGTGKSKKWAVSLDELHRHKGVPLHYPVREGIVDDWDGVEEIWDRGFKLLGTRPSAERHPVLLAEAAWAPADQRAKYAELMFERFQVPGLFISKTPVLACFANARSSGLVLDVGGAVTSAVAVHDGQVLQKAVKRTNLAGDALSAELADAIQRGGHVTEALADATHGGASRSSNVSLHPRCELAKTRSRDGRHPPLPAAELNSLHESYRQWARLDLADEIKRSLCHLADREPAVASDEGAVPKLEYDLPDGTKLQVGSERFRVPELLFNPGVGRYAAASPLPKLVCDSALECPLDMRKELFSSIVLTGGGSTLRGLDLRVYNGVRDLAPPVFKILKPLVAAPEERRAGAWLGGSILGSLDSCHDMWVSSAEYQESGAAVIEKKCP